MAPADDADTADTDQPDAEPPRAFPSEAASEWPLLSTVTEYETPYFEAGYDLVERPNGDRARYYWLHPPDAAIVVPVTDAGDLVLVEQYRPRHRVRSLECPGGAIDAGESALEAGRRELREETGYRAGDLEVLTEYYPSGWDRYSRTVLAATELDPGEPAHDDGEFIDVRTLDPEAALARAREPPGHGWLLTPLLLARDAGVI